jgi:hypothetical protein
MVWVVLSSLAIAGCSSGNSQTSGDPKGGDPKGASDSITVSFKKDLEPILSKTCARPSCHGAAKSAGMQLSEGAAYENLVKIKSTEVPRYMRVDPGIPDSSYIVMKLEGRQAVGRRMPLIGKPLSEKEIKSIRDWIASGAKND